MPPSRVSIRAFLTNLAPQKGVSLVRAAITRCRSRPPCSGMIVRWLFVATLMGSLMRLDAATSRFVPEAASPEGEISLASERSGRIAVIWWEFSQRGTARTLPASRRCEYQRDVKCALQQFQVDIKRMSRLVSPNSSFYLLADRSAIDAYYSNALRELNVRVRYREHYRERASKYERMHANTKRMRHPAEMLSRFCELADLAKRENFSRVLSLDVDVALFDDADSIFSSFVEGVVTPCDTCSQVVLHVWRPTALDQFCDGLLRFWEDRALVRQLFGNTTWVFNRFDFNDMDFLRIFLYNPAFRDYHPAFRDESGRGGSKGISRRIQTDNERFPLRWLAAHSYVAAIAQGQAAGSSTSHWDNRGSSQSTTP